MVRVWIGKMPNNVKRKRWLQGSNGAVQSCKDALLGQVKGFIRLSSKWSFATSLRWATRRHSNCYVRQFCVRMKCIFTYPNIPTISAFCFLQLFIASCMPSVLLGKFYEHGAFSKRTSRLRWQVRNRVTFRWDVWVWATMQKFILYTVSN